MDSNQEGRRRQKVSRVVKILTQLSEHLVRDEIITIRSNIKKATELSRDFDRQTVKEFLKDYVKMIHFRSGISVNLLKQSVRSLLMIAHDEKLGNDVHSMFTEYIVREHQSITIGMELDDELLRVYFKALEYGHEPAKHIRLMVVGMFHVGKTTLLNKLLNKPDTGEDPESTVGIDISVNACEVDQDGKWETTTFQDKDKRFQARLQHIFNMNKPKQERKAKTDTKTTVIYERDTEDSTKQKEVEPVVEPELDPPQSSTELPPLEPINLKLRTRCKHEYEKEIKEKTPGDNPKYFEGIKKAKESPKQQEELIKRPTISTWDFAGQSVYYSTHHFFLNPRAIYLLVLDLSIELNKMVDEKTHLKGAKNLHLGNETKHFTQLDAFQFWMKSIYIYTKQKQSTTSPDYRPTIILVGTHKDMLGRDKGDPDVYAEQYFQKALESVLLPAAKDLIYDKKFFISKDDSKGVFEELKSEIFKVAKHQPFWEEQIPGKFIPLEREVVKTKNEKADVMFLEKLEEVSRESHYPLKDEEIKLFLKFQHAFGNILHYDKANPSMIVLTPQWIIDAFKLFVTHTASHDSEEWKEFKDIGKLSNGLVEELLKAEWNVYKEEILKYMEYLNIIAKPVFFKDNTAAVQERSPTKEDEIPDWCVSITGDNVSSEDFHFMPCVLPARPKADKIKEMLECDHGESSPVLCMYIRGVFLPPFVFHRILATCITKMPVYKHLDKYVLYSEMGVFEIDETTQLTIWSWGNMIYLKVTSCHIDSKQKMSTANLTKVQKYFDDLVKKLFDMQSSQNVDKVEISYYVTCPKCPEKYPFDRKTDEDGFPIDEKCGLLLVKDLQFKLHADKICNPNRHHIKCLDALTKWFKVQDCAPVPDEKLLIVPDDIFLANLTKEIDPNKKYTLASKLNFNDKEYQHIQEDNKQNVCSIIFQVLRKWKVETGETLAVLREAALAGGCTEKEFDRILDGKLNVKEEKMLHRVYKDDITNEKIGTTDLNQHALTKLSECVGKQYWLLGIRLGLTNTEIEHLCSTPGASGPKIVLQILLKWKQCEEATVEEQNRMLIKAMIQSECDPESISKCFR